jgi:hypothetical protein
MMRSFSLLTNICPPPKSVTIATGTVLENVYFEAAWIDK